MSLPSKNLIPGLTEEQSRGIRKIFDKTLPQGIHVYLFGSRARGTNRKYSDMDLALESSSAIASDVMLKLYDEFEESDLPFRTEIVDILKVDADFRDHIQPDLIKIYS